MMTRRDETGRDETQAMANEMRIYYYKRRNQLRDLGVTAVPWFVRRLRSSPTTFDTNPTLSTPTTTTAAEDDRCLKRRIAWIDDCIILRAAWFTIMHDDAMPCHAPPLLSSCWVYSVRGRLMERMLSSSPWSFATSRHNLHVARLSEAPSHLSSVRSHLRSWTFFLRLRFKCRNKNKWMPPDVTALQQQQHLHIDSVQRDGTAHGTTATINPHE